MLFELEVTMYIILLEEVFDKKKQYLSFVNFLVLKKALCSIDINYVNKSYFIPLKEKKSFTLPFIKKL